MLGSLAFAGPALAAPDDHEYGVLLQPRDPAALEAFATAASTPGSPQFGQYLRGGAFGERFGPTPATVDAVRAALSSAGLEAGRLPANSLILPMHGTAAAAQDAFGTLLVDNTPSNPPSLPAAVTDEIVAALDYGNPTNPGGARAARGSTAPTRSTPARVAPPTPCAEVVAAADAAVTAGGKRPWLFDQIAQAYDFTRVRAAGGWGQGVTVALMEWEGFLPADVAHFQQCYGTSADVVPIDINGGPDSTGHRGEAELDIDVLAGLAPETTIQVYQGPNAETNTDWLSVFAAIATDNEADIVSTSWGGCEATGDAVVIAAETPLLLQMAAQGQSAMAAAGDDGSEDCGYPHHGLSVDDPGAQPWMLSVGGTGMSAIGDPPALRPTEVVWNVGNDPSYGGGGGGGVSENFVMPPWQAGPGVIGPRSSHDICNAPTGQHCRQVPDVSALANSNQGYLMYDTNNGGAWNGNGGTSAAAPLWAAMAASILSTPQCNGQRLGLLGPRLYPLAAVGGSAAFNDVMTGTNDLSGVASGFYDATPGYDMASGLGTPVGGGLLAGICPVAPVPTSAGSGAEPAPERAPDPAATPAPAPVQVPTPAIVPEPPAAAPRAEIRGQAITATPDGRLSLGVRCPAGEADCRIDIRVRGRGVDLRLRNRRVEAGATRSLPFRLPRQARGKSMTLTVTVTSRSADGRTTTSTKRITVRPRGRGKG